MITASSFRKSALSLEQVTELPHFDKASFRIQKKIFATLDSVNKTASLKLSAAEQSVYCQIKPNFCSPATGAWGRQGWTIFNLNKVAKPILTEALKQSYVNVAPAGVSKAKKTSTKATEMIQTLHPDKSKTNKRISVEKYQFIKVTLLSILQSGELTHTALMEELYLRIKDNFEGGVQWYGETVKLDLEARQVIERVGRKPEKYRLHFSEGHSAWYEQSS